MKKILGVIFLVVGVGLVVWAYNMSQSFSGQISEAFTGSPGDKPMWLYIGGGVLCALGLFQIFVGKK